MFRKADRYGGRIQKHKEGDRLIDIEQCARGKKKNTEKDVN